MPNRSRRATAYTGYFGEAAKETRGRCTPSLATAQQLAKDQAQVVCSRANQMPLVDVHDPTQPTASRAAGVTDVRESIALLVAPFDAFPRPLFDLPYLTTVLGRKPPIACVKDDF